MSVEQSHQWIITSIARSVLILGKDGEENVEGGSQKQTRLVQRKNMKFASKETSSGGQLLNELLKNAIKKCFLSRKVEVVHKSIKKVEEFPTQDLAYNEVIGYMILPKLFYLEEKCEQKGMPLKKIQKQNYKIQKLISKELSNYRSVQKFYKVAKLFAEDEDGKMTNERPQERKSRKKEQMTREDHHTRHQRRHERESPEIHHGKKRREDEHHRKGRKEDREISRGRDMSMQERRNRDEVRMETKMAHKGYRKFE